MHWDDIAILLSVRKHGETGAVARVLAREHGVYGGAARGAWSKSQRGVWQPGNRLQVRWQARLSEHLGNLKGELLAPCAAMLMQDALKLAALSSACALLESALPERHPYPALYDRLETLLATLRAGSEWQEDYVRFELAVLAQTGFGLDLGRCAATGRADDLVYVSPKSGRAVCREAGAPYHEKLLPLPGFLQANPASEGTAAEGLRLTGYFLTHWLLEPHGRRLPAARKRLEAMV